MKRFIILGKEDGSEVAMETTCIRQIETAEQGRRCYVYYFGPKSWEAERICVIGTVRELVEKINEIEAERK